jgi:hypothetical protein
METRQMKEEKRALLNTNEDSYDVIASVPSWDPMKIILVASAYESSS